MTTYTLETARTARRFTNKRRTVKGITIHHWGSDGSSFDGIVSWFCAPDTTAQTSAHYVAQGTNANGSSSRRVACIVDPDLIAWHAGDWQANVDTIGIECRPEARAEDYAVVAELVRRLRSVYGDVPLYPHRHWAATACPGRWNLERLDVLARQTPTPEEDEDMPTAKEIAAEVWKRAPWPGKPGVPGSTIPNNIGYQTVWAQQTLTELAALRGEVAGLTSAMAQLAAGDAPDLEAIRAAATAGTAAALAGYRLELTPPEEATP